MVREVQVEIDFQNKLRTPSYYYNSLIFSMSCSLSYNANSHFRILVVRQSIKAFKFTFKVLEYKIRRESLNTKMSGEGQSLLGGNFSR